MGGRNRPANPRIRPCAVRARASRARADKSRGGAFQRRTPAHRHWRRNDSYRIRNKGSGERFAATICCSRVRTGAWLGRSGNGSTVAEQGIEGDFCLLGLSFEGCDQYLRRRSTAPITRAKRSNAGLDPAVFTTRIA